jgi:sugar lactone lactonase YvrE
MADKTSSTSSRVVKSALLSILLSGLPLLEVSAQKVETVGGVKLVHNEKGGQWGKKPKVALELVRKIGDVDAMDETVAFNQPGDVAVDAKGNLYILDSANCRVQKFGPDGKFLATFGRKGQGPGEFVLPDSINFDKAGNLVVFDPYQRRIQHILAEGKDAKMVSVSDQQLNKMRFLRGGGFAAKGRTFLPSLPMPGEKAQPASPKLIKIVDEGGKLIREFGDLVDLGDPMTSGFGSEITFDVNDRDEIIAAYRYQNRVEKFAPEGKILWRADRPLNYAVEVKVKGEMKTSGAGGGGVSVSMKAPQMNSCTTGVAIDPKGRAWVVTYNRQLKKEEQVQTQMMMSMGGAGGQTVSSKVCGDTDLRTTDALKLEIFDPEGVFLGEVPLTHFVDIVRFQGNFLFMIDRDRGATVYQYKVIEK